MNKKILLLLISTLNCMSAVKGMEVEIPDKKSVIFLAQFVGDHFLIKNYSYHHKDYHLETRNILNKNILDIIPLNQTNRTIVGTTIEQALRNRAKTTAFYSSDVLRCKVKIVPLLSTENVTQILVTVKVQE
jgi:hypothetical protein